MKKSKTKSKHSTRINFTHEVSRADLSWILANLRYDQLSFFLEEFAEVMAVYAINDRNAKKRKLAGELDKVVKDLRSASKNTYEAWKICKPYMDKE